VRGLSKFARLDAAQILVTDSGFPADGRTVLSEHIERVIVAEPLRARRRAR
jgi:hypothetical protein